MFLSNDMVSLIKILHLVSSKYHEAVQMETGEYIKTILYLNQNNIVFERKCSFIMSISNNKKNHITKNSAFNKNIWGEMICSAIKTMINNKGGKRFVLLWKVKWEFVVYLH